MAQAEAAWWQPFTISRTNRIRIRGTGRVRISRQWCQQRMENVRCERDQRG